MSKAKIGQFLVYHLVIVAALSGGAIRTVPDTFRGGRGSVVAACSHPNVLFLSFEVRIPPRL